ncbi:hypothetical protein C9439_00300 [archaeon SCG-AAA382B04]|nr:hypothetical protein C9439_00300 [archaeon SCG-AAA382B04]
MPKGDYQSQTLPTELIEKIDEYVENFPKYNSRADFIKEAVNDKIEELKERKEIEEKAKEIELSEKEKAFVEELMKKHGLE